MCWFIKSLSAQSYRVLRRVIGLGLWLGVRGLGLGVRGLGLGLMLGVRA